MILRKITKKILLLVEGKDEESFFEAFIEYLKLDLDSVDIFCVEGKNNFKNHIPVLFKNAGMDKVKKIAIIRDADENAKSALESIANVLMKVGVKKSKRDEYIFNGRKVFIYIMPDNKNKGMLETLCLKSVKNNPVMTCVNKFERCLKHINTNPKNMEKTKSLVFLAAMPEDVHSVGIGAKKGYWDFSAKEFESLKKFIKKLIKPI